MDSLFRIARPAAADVEAFHRDGYIFFPDVLQDAARQALIDEILHSSAVRQYLETARPDAAPQAYFVRPWDARGPVGHRLIDDPFIESLLRATIGSDYHFCHSALNLAPRGVGPIPYHQDHHHWNHAHPINLAERDKYYIQILYYPNGFSRGDRNLSVIPGSHRLAPSREVTPEKMLAGVYDEEAGRPLREVRLEVPPGSMVYINARIFHAVEAKPADSPQAHRIFTIDIFKEAGPPHRYTQAIPPAWLEGASPYRQKLFRRAPYSEGCWEAADA